MDCGHSAVQYHFLFLALDYVYSIIYSVFSLNSPAGRAKLYEKPKEAQHIIKARAAAYRLSGRRISVDSIHMNRRHPSGLSYGRGGVSFELPNIEGSHFSIYTPIFFSKSFLPPLFFFKIIF